MWPTIPGQHSFQLVPNYERQVPQQSTVPRQYQFFQTPISFAAPYRPMQARQFPCCFDGCGQSFKRAEHLSRHMRIHTGEKPYKCPIPGCPKRFSRSDNLSQHMKSHGTKRNERVSRENSKSESESGRRTSQSENQDQNADLRSQTPSPQFTPKSAALRSTDIRFLLADPMDSDM